MKKISRLEIRVDDDFLEQLDNICRTQAGIRTRAAAIYFCVETISKRKQEEKKEES